MATTDGFGSDSDAVLFLVAATAVFTIIAAFCSSPQTTELNAGQRAKTLMKWVNIGMVNAAVFVSIAVLLDKKRWPSILGGGLAGTSLYLSYAHAKRAGLASAAPGTESC